MVFIAWCCTRCTANSVLDSVLPLAANSVRLLGFKLGSVLALHLAANSEGHSEGPSEGHSEGHSVLQTVAHLELSSVVKSALRLICVGVVCVGVVCVGAVGASVLEQYAPLVLKLWAPCSVVNLEPHLVEPSETANLVPRSAANSVLATPGCQLGAAVDFKLGSALSSALD
jgi:hypothetical protein